MAYRKETGKIDFSLLIATLALLAFGLTMIALTGAVLSKTRFGDEYHLFRRHFLFGVIPGIIVMFLALKIHYRFWKRNALILFGLAVGLLVLVLIPQLWGMEIKGARSWIDLGWASFQPVEFAKLALIIYLAAWMEGRKKQLASFQEGFLPFSIFVGIMAVLIIAQPDIGSLGVITMIALVMYFLAGAPLKYIFLLIVSGVSSLLILINTSTYRKERLLSFLDSGADVQGSGYQINQALIAIGSGGIFGLGLGQSRQKFNYLPEPIGDSIYAIVGEELGMIGAVIIVIFYLFFALRGYRIAKQAPDKFASLTAAGITTWIVLQAFVNIMAILGLIPLTGITLPLISYGSTSLLLTLFSIGILLNISRYTKIK
ncbi:MAG TPA: putative lipid II flippase FtsW [Candidatus Moranbacteria bacterium]|nr:putative lipid II flippase FtsW [Candidatus Moranbacteria bacterium]